MAIDRRKRGKTANKVKSIENKEESPECPSIKSCAK